MSEIVITFHDGTTQVFDADTVRTVQHITTAIVWTDGEPRPAPPTETLTQAVERVTTPPRNDLKEAVQFLTHGHNFPCPNRPHNSCENHAFVGTDGVIQQCAECHAEMYPEPTDQEMIEMAEEMQPKARKVRALETQPRAQPRSSCCGTLGRRMSRFGNYCSACQHHNDEDRAAMMMVNTSFVKIVEGEE